MVDNKDYLPKKGRQGRFNFYEGLAIACNNKGGCTKLNTKKTPSITVFCIHTDFILNQPFESWNLSSGVHDKSNIERLPM